MRPLIGDDFLKYFVQRASELNQKRINSNIPLPTEYLGTVGERFPNVATTKSGHYIGDIHMVLDPNQRGDDAGAYYQNTKEIVLGPSHQGEFDPEGNVAGTILHELVHAAQAEKGRYDFLSPEMQRELTLAHYLPFRAYTQLPWERGAYKIKNPKAVAAFRAGRPILGLAAPVLPTAAHMIGKAAEGAGIPTPEQARPLALLLGQALAGDKDARFAISQIAKGMASGITRQPIDAMNTLTDPSKFSVAAMEALHNLRSDPTGSAAYGVGMAGAMMGPEELAKAIQFGGKALKGAERRVIGREANVQRRLVEGYEGQATKQPLDVPGNAPDYAESPGDYIAWASKQPDNVLAMHARYLTDDPIRGKIAQKILHERGWRGDISDVEHNALENQNVDLGPYKGAAPTSIWTREDEGGQMLNKANINMGAQNLPQAIGHMLNKSFKDAPPGTPVAYNGERWVQTTKGFTRMQDAKIQIDDLDWILHRNINPDDMVHLIQTHGGHFGETERRARAIVANHIFTMGDAAPEHYREWRDAWKRGLQSP